MDDYPFYVGIGRAARATDRLRYVRSLLIPKNAAKLGKTSLSVRVMAELLRRKVEIRLSCTRRPMNRRQALTREKADIARLLGRGFMLTNWQHNPLRHNDHHKAVRTILSRKRSFKR